MPVAVFDFQLTGPEALANVQFSAAKVWGVRPSFGGTLGLSWDRLLCLALSCTSKAIDQRLKMESGQCNPREIFTWSRQASFELSGAKAYSTELVPYSESKETDN
jgi:hypothetical protein